MKTVSEARQEFFAGVEKLQKVLCPCCQRLANLYDVTIINYMLIQLLRQMPNEPIKTQDLPRVQTPQSDGKFVTVYSILPHFGLLTQVKTGLWQTNRSTKRFLAGDLRVTSDILIFDKRPFACSLTQVSIDDVTKLTQRMGCRSKSDIPWSRLPFKMPEDIDIDMPVDEARERHLASIDPPGTYCVVCSRHDQVYHRPLTPDMARVLGVMHRRHGVDKPVHVYNKIDACGGDYAKLAHWGFIQPGDERGEWALTRQGAEFASNTGTTFSHAKLYHGEFRGFAGRQITFQEVFGKKFSPRDLFGKQD